MPAMIARTVTGVLAFCVGGAGAAEKPREENQRMIEDQIIARGVTQERLLAALRAVPRDRFVPAEYRREAYADHPLPIGYGQTISQPFIVAFMTEAAAIRRGSKVLEIGTGSGYQAAVLAALGARVFTIEIVPALARRAATTLKELGYDQVQVRTADGYRGWPEEAPFDAIVVTAAPAEVPPALIDQLADGGRLVIPVGPQSDAQELRLLTKTGGTITQRTLLPVRFVPFTRERQ